jgi:hypothetical protein
MGQWSIWFWLWSLTFAQSSLWKNTLNQSIWSSSIIITSSYEIETEVLYIWKQKIIKEDSKYVRALKKFKAAKCIFKFIKDRKIAALKERK